MPRSFGGSRAEEPRTMSVRGNSILIIALAALELGAIGTTRAFDWPSWTTPVYCQGCGKSVPGSFFPSNVVYRSGVAYHGGCVPPPPQAPAAYQVPAPYGAVAPSGPAAPAAPTRPG